MAWRSLEIQYNTLNDVNKKILSQVVKAENGSGYASIQLPCEGTVDENGVTEPYEIIVYVDGETDNSSFTVEHFGDWFKYKIERVLIKDGDDYKHYVKVLLYAKENLDTSDKLGELIITHKVANISFYIDLKQKPTVYSIEVTYDTDGIFKIVPEEEKTYEEKVLNVTANGGSRKWFVKDVEQYEVHSLEDWEGKKNGDEITEADRDGEMPVEFDKALEYHTDVENGKLYVRSYGRVDLSQYHMRYYFRICHCDVNNTNNIYNEKTYEISQLFIFKGGNINGYGQ